MTPFQMAVVSVATGALWVGCIMGASYLAMRKPVHSDQSSFSSSPKRMSLSDLTVITAALRQKAEAAIPTVRAAQPERFAEFQSDYEKRVAAFSFRCERFGDFLSVFAERLGAPKTVLAINLADAPIQLREGRKPDMDGTGYFEMEKVFFSGGNAPEFRLSFPGFGMIGALNVANHAESEESLGYIQEFRQGLSASVDHIARESVDDRIIFGAGGGSAFNFNGGGSISTSDFDRLKNATLPGATIYVPAGLGAKVYSDILAAIKAGAPENKP